MKRRHFLGAAVAGLASTSGCVGFLLGETATYSATKATVGDEALSKTGYEQSRVKKMTAKRTFEVGGQTREVEVVNWVADYEKSVGIDGVAEGTAAKATVLASPQFEIAGESINPLDDYSNRKLVEKFVGQYGSVRNVRSVGSGKATMLSKKVTVSKFAGTATVGGAKADVNIHVAKVKHGDDVVVFMGVYPKRLDDEDAVFELVSGVQHSG